MFKFRKYKEENLLNERIDVLIKLIEKSNLDDILYIVGSKKELIKRNMIAGIFRGVGIRAWCYCYYWYFGVFIKKDCCFKYSGNWRVYS